MMFLNVSDKINFACALAFVGFSIIPITAGTKLPAIRSWAPFQMQRATEPTITKWFNNETSTIGIVTGKISDLVVIDCDDQKSAEWAQQNLPHTYRVETANGCHLYYSHPGEGKVSNKARLRTVPEGLKIDIRGDGGYVLGVGAVHPSGKRYRGPEGVYFGAIRSHMKPFPLWVIEEQAEQTPEPEPPLPKPAPTRKEEFGRQSDQERAILLIESFSGVVEGGRNNKANEIAFAALKGFNVGDDPLVWSAFEKWNSKNSPPLPARELKTVWKSALNARCENPGYLSSVPREIDKKGLLPKSKPTAQEPLKEVSDSKEKAAQESRVKMERDFACFCSLNDRQAVLLNRVDPEDFTDYLAKFIHLSAARATKDGLPVTPISVMGYLAQVHSVTSAQAYEDHVLKVRKDFTLDELEGMIGLIQAQAARVRLTACLGKHLAQVENLKKSIPELQVELCDDIFKACSAHRKNLQVHEVEVMEEAYIQSLDQQLAKEKGEGVIHLKTGIGSLDRFLSPGIERGEYLLIVGHSGGGKSSLGDQIVHAFADHGTMLYITFEIPKVEMARRAACRALGIERKNLTPGDQARYKENHVKDVVWVDKFEPNADLILQEIQVFLMRHPKAIGFCLDQISQVERGNMKLKEAIEYISPKLKQIAIKHNCVAIVLNQENNEPFEDVKRSKSPIKPTPRYMRDSQRPFHDSDRCLHLWRPSRFYPGEPKDLVELHFTKNRHGKQDFVRLTEELCYYRFADRDGSRPLAKHEQLSLIEGVRTDDIF